MWVEVPARTGRSGPRAIFPSVHGSIDDEASNAHYLFEAVPLPPEIAEAADRQLEAHPA